MPRTTVLMFQESDGQVPLLEWMDALPAKVQDKCIVKIERLGELGHELRRPEADLLRNGVYELRVAYRRVQYRMLYFFQGQEIVISHGLRKESEVPEEDIRTALRRMETFKNNPRKHTYEE